MDLLQREVWVARRTGPLVDRPAVPFSPIAIVGRACLLPSASSPSELATLAREGRDAITSVDASRWGISSSRVMGAPSDNSGDRTWTDRGGYVRGFDERFDPSGFGMPVKEVLGLDPLFQWTLHVAREAMRDASGLDPARTGAILGNLSFPPGEHARFAESVFFEGTPFAPSDRPDPQNRFSSGLPALLLGKALGLKGPRFCLDAACASSLYAIALACQALNDREVDWMLAGAVNRADDLFIHVGFCALQAMSKTGQSRPFHAEADGLIPAEGCAMVVLRRLDDALSDGDRILGVIRGVGLSNDGRGRGLLSPHEDGQVRAMRQAWEQAGLDPNDCAYVECHATGTKVGDATELRSMREVFGGNGGLKIGSFKANFGHAVTAAGTAGLLKVLASFEERTLFPTPHAEVLNPALIESPFTLVRERQRWPEGKPLLAAVSAFGFGGNDAHLVVSGPVAMGEEPPSVASSISPKPRVVISAIGAQVGPLSSSEAFAAALAAGGAMSQRSESVALELTGLRFPPADLAQTLAQQTMLLAASREVLAKASDLRTARTAVLVGMGCDAEVTRWGARWRIADRAIALGQSEDFAAAARESIAPHLQAATVVGTMPNIPANRTSSDLDARGPSFTVSCEEQSGTVALGIGRRMLEEGSVDAALIGAVDLSVEPVHQVAARALLPKERQRAADAAVVLLLEREDDARAAGRPILAVLAEGDEGAVFDVDHSALTQRLGHAHAASGLLHVAAAALGLHHPAVGDRLRLSGDAVRVRVPCLGGETRSVVLRAGDRGAAIGEARALEGRLLTLPAHPPAVSLPPMRGTAAASASTFASAPAAAPSAVASVPSRPQASNVRTNGSHPHKSFANVQTMAPAPWVPPVSDVSRAPAPVAAPAARTAPVAPSPVASAPVASAPIAPASFAMAHAEPAMGDPVFSALASQHAAMTAAHQVFLDTQLELHQRFLVLRERALGTLAHGGAIEQPADASIPTAHRPLADRDDASPLRSEATIWDGSGAQPQGERTARPQRVLQRTERRGASTDSNSDSGSVADSVSGPVSASASASVSASVAASAAAPRPNPKTTGGIQPNPFVRPTGRTWDREELKIDASGKISTIFGPEFAPQDDCVIQTRMPMEPMLLADRVTGIDAMPAAMTLPLEADPKRRRGTVWTETDITRDSWYVHQGRMPGGILIESGQADLFLISYLGVDLLNLGSRAYRLLGCELTYHRSPPKIGETIGYDIHIDGHANQGPIKLFFFHYDCRVRSTDTALPDDGGEPMLSVRNGQAGFFTEKELDDSAGILWKPEEQEVVKSPRLDTPVVPLHKTAFSNEEIRAFSEGRAHDCFGSDFDATRSHVRTPRIAEGRLMFLDRIDELDSRGGPWKRGYLKATTAIHPDDWFFPGHFHNDPCMPGTLMFEGCLQAMAFYLASQGVTLARDGWRFEPVTGETYKLLCRGQVTPKSKELVYEIFVEEFVAGPIPMVYADLLCTVDGLGAFHARRMALRLVPDWPLEEYPRLFSADAMAPTPTNAPASVPQNDPSKPVAVAQSGPSKGFVFDYASLVACAWGRPSDAFGKIYERFDSPRKVARLPGPPYHFMSRITHVEGPMGEAKSGAMVEVDYDIPQDVWYFRENGAPTMPYAVLMEAALQPCGWLASYIGSALTMDDDVLFRNLDGKATLFTDLLPSSGTLKTKAKLKSYSKSGTMIIVGFDVECTIGGQKVYTLDTVFGFFPTTAFENQAGLPVSDAQKALFDAAPTTEQVQLKGEPEHALRTTAPRLAAPFLCMIDRIVHIDRTGGAKGLGAFRAEKDVNPDEWFFKAHFFQDPVQPGSLGVEAMCQLLQSAMRLLDLHQGFRSPRFEPVGLERPHVWKYRGQVVPKNEVISCTLEITETGKDERGTFAVADASLWVDGKRIYDCKGLAMRIVEDDLAPLPPPEGRDPTSSPSSTTSTASASRVSGEAAEGVEVLDLARDAWLADHAPTWVLPALPATFFLDRVERFAASQAAALGKVVGEVEWLSIERWVTLAAGASARLRPRILESDDDGITIAIESFREARDPRLSRYESVASARVRFTAHAHEIGGESLPLLDGGARQPDPYASGALFHGPAFQLVTELTLGASGASAHLDCARAPSDPAARRVVILDAALHAIPHDGLHGWDPTLPSDRAAYPRRIESARIAHQMPEGRARAEVRYLGKDEHGQARSRVVLIDESSGRAVMDLILVEVLLPKGPIGAASPSDRAAFLQGAFRPGVALSQPLEDGTTRLLLRDIAVSNWLPGTLERVYRLPAGADLPSEIAERDHVARLAGCHPRHVRVRGEHAVALTEPLVRHDLVLVRDESGVSVRSRGPAHLDVAPVRSFWRKLLGNTTSNRPLGKWPGEELHLALIERFMGRLRVADPDALAKIHGRSVLFLGNHQVGIESLLFGIAASALVGTPTTTLAKQEHKESWLGKLIEQSFAWPALGRAPSVIAFFDRQDPSSLPRIIGELGESMKRPEGQSVMIHVEGTRQTAGGRPVEKMSGVFVDLALTLGAPIVPVRFSRGLPREEAESRLEFPVGLGRQDYDLGVPILPEDLAKLPYKERTERVMQAINATGVAHADELPCLPDPMLSARAETWRGATQSMPHAVIAAVLDERRKDPQFKDLGPELSALLDSLESDDDLEAAGSEGLWLAELRALFR